MTFHNATRIWDQCKLQNLFRNNSVIRVALTLHNEIYSESHGDISSTIQVSTHGNCFVSDLHATNSVYGGDYRTAYHTVKLNDPKLSRHGPH